MATSEVTDQVYRNRLGQWVSLINERGLAGAVSFGYPTYTHCGTMGHSTIRFLTGWTARFEPTAVVVRPDGQTMLVVCGAHDLLYARAEFPWFSTVESAPADLMMEVCLQWLGGNAGSVGVTGDFPYQMMRELNKSRKVVSLDEDSAQLRKIKDAFALRHHEQAAATSDAMVDKFFAKLASEDNLVGQDVMASAEYAGRVQGAELCVCWLGIGNGGRPSYRMEQVAGRDYPSGERAIMGTYTTAEGYFAHSLRTGFRSAGPLTPSARDGMAMAIDQHAVAASAIVPGEPASAVTRKALNWIDNQERAELGAACLRQGHFLGLDYAEYPTNSRAFPQPPQYFTQRRDDLCPEVVFEPGMVLEVHTNFDHPDFGLMVMGDVYAVTETGARRLTQAPQNPYL